MTLRIDHLRTNRTVMEILRKFPPIQNKSKHEYHRRGKTFYYGLKSSDFNKFDFENGENGDRIFNYWRDKLVEIRFLIKIQPFKEKGSPYAITPLGVAWIMQNLHQDDIDWDNEVTNCLNVILHFYKGDSSGLNHETNWANFIKACKMIGFEMYGYSLKTWIGDDMEADMSLDISFKERLDPKDPLKNKQDFEDIANHIIGNMCWLQLHMRMIQIQTKKWLDRKEDNSFYIPPVSKQTIKIGKTFGDKVVLRTLAEESQRVVNVLEDNPSGF